MKKLVLGSLITIAATSNVFAACSYTLDASNNQIEQMQPNISQKFLEVNTLTQQVNQPIGVFGNKYIFLAGSSLGTQNLLNFTQNPQITVFGNVAVQQNGISVFEYKFNNYPAQLTGVNRQVIKSGLIVYAGTQDTDIQNIVINATLDNVNEPSYLQSTNLNVSFYNFKTNQNANYTYPISMPLQSGFKLGFYINQESKQIGLNVNGVNKGYIFGLDKKIGKISFFPRADIEVPQNSSIIGQNLKGTLLTNSADITLSYPVGATDICGNVI